MPLDDSIVLPYGVLVIASFTDPDAARVFQGHRSRRLPPDLQRPALRKLVYLHAAHTLNDLRIPPVAGSPPSTRVAPGNRLEALRGDREGQHSIRINDQWRICFRWLDGDAHDVHIVDYH
jgi:proteic killer suppression protein